MRPVTLTSLIPISIDSGLIKGAVKGVAGVIMTSTCSKTLKMLHKAVQNHD